MKRLLFSVFTSILPFIGMSQFTFQNNGDTLKVEPLNKDVEFFLQLKNDTSITYDVRWRIMENNFPDTTWHDFTCDYYCYNSDTRANTFQLNKDTNFLIIHHIASAKSHGLGSSTLCIFDPADSANTIQCLTLWVQSDTNQDPIGIKEATTNRLAQNYPNPFSESTNIPYILNGFGSSHLIICDIFGQIVKSILLNPSQISISVPADFDPGTYFYAIEQNGTCSQFYKMSVLAN